MAAGHPLIKASIKDVESWLSRDPQVSAWHSEQRAVGGERLWRIVNYARSMHAPRFVRALADGRDLPVKPTPPQAKQGIEAEHLMQLNELYCASLDRWLEAMARDMGDLAVLFSDPDRLSARVKNPRA